MKPLKEKKTVTRVFSALTSLLSLLYWEAELSVHFSNLIFSEFLWARIMKLSHEMNMSPVNISTEFEKWWRIIWSWLGLKTLNHAFSIQKSYTLTLVIRFNLVCSSTPSKQKNHITFHFWWNWKCTGILEINDMARLYGLLLVAAFLPSLYRNRSLNCYGF